jgi:hypothetical protein
MPKIIAYVMTNLAGSKCQEEYDLPDDWNEMSEDEQQNYLDDIATEHMANNSEYGAYVKED